MSEKFLVQEGVELIIDGLVAFERGILKANKLIDSIGDTADKTGGKVSPLTRLLEGLGDTIRRVFEFAGGILLADLFKSVADGVRELFNALVDVGSEFQSLFIRLSNFAALDIMKGGVLSYTEAVQQAVPPTEELFNWVQKLAMETPFDIQDIADIFTLARAYGLSTEGAKELTKATSDFVAGMGLSGDVMERIVIALGQMLARGKVTGEELRQLGNASVPVIEIQRRLAERLNVSTDEFARMQRQGLIPANEFMEVFIELVGERFPNAAERASRTLKGATGNIRDMIQGIFGFNVVRPILDVISGGLADLVDAFTEGERGTRFIAAAKNIGDALSGMLASIATRLPSVESIAESVIGFLERLAGKLIGIREIVEAITGGQVDLAGGVSAILLGFDVPQEIVDRVSDVMKFIESIPTRIQAVRDLLNAMFEGDLGLQQGFMSILLNLGVPENIVGGLNDLVNKIRDSEFADAVKRFMENVQSAFQNFKMFWDQHGDAILEDLDRILGALLGTGETGGITILDILGSQLQRFSEMFTEENGDQIERGFSKFADWVVEDFFPIMNKVLTWVDENQDELTNFLVFLLKLKIVFDTLIIIGKLAAAAALTLASVPMLIIASFLFAVAEMFTLSGERGEELKRGLESWEIIFKEQLPIIIGHIANAIEDAVKELRDEDNPFNKAIKTWIDNTQTTVNEKYETFKTWGRNFIQKISDGVYERFQDFIIGIRNWFSNIPTVISNAAGNFYEKGREWMQNLSDGFYKRFTDFFNAIPGWFSNVVSRIKNFVADLWNAGYLVMQGFSDGFYKRFLDFLSGASGWFRDFYYLVLNRLGIHSPSTLFAQIGENVMAGLEMGIEKGIPNVVTAMSDAVSNMLKAGAASVPLAARVGSNITTTNNFALTVNSQARVEPIIADFQMMKSIVEGLS